MNVIQQMIADIETLKVKVMKIESYLEIVTSPKKKKEEVEEDDIGIETSEP